MPETLDFRVRAREGSYELREAPFSNLNTSVADEFRLLAYSRCKDTQKRSLTLAVDIQRHKRRTNSAR